MANQITTIQKRFFEKVKKLENGCWDWMASKSKKGYGYFKCTSFTKSLAHQVSYILFKGDIPKGLLVCHSCDNPSCVNPDHLWVGTAKKNTLDMQLKRRDRQRKLCEEYILDIRRKFKNGQMTQNELAILYNIKPSTVWSIIRYQTWKHVK